jgi:hypothetical protein
LKAFFLFLALFLDFRQLRDLGFNDSYGLAMLT